VPRTQTLLFPSTFYRTRSFLNLVFKRSHVLYLKLHQFFLSRKNLMFSSRGVVGVGGNVAGRGGGGGGGG